MMKKMYNYLKAKYRYLYIKIKYRNVEPIKKEYIYE